MELTSYTADTGFKNGRNNQNDTAKRKIPEGCTNK